MPGFNRPRKEDYPSIREIENAKDEGLAERIYLIVIDRVTQNSARHIFPLPELAKYAHEAAKAFREYKPESHE